MAFVHGVRKGVSLSTRIRPASWLGVAKTSLRSFESKEGSEAPSTPAPARQHVRLPHHALVATAGDVPSCPWYRLCALVRLLGLARGELPHESPSATYVSTDGVIVHRDLGDCALKGYFPIKRPPPPSPLPPSPPLPPLPPPPPPSPPRWCPELCLNDTTATKFGQNGPRHGCKRRQLDGTGSHGTRQKARRAGPTNHSLNPLYPQALGAAMHMAFGQGRHDRCPPECRGFVAPHVINAGPPPE